MSFCCSSKEFKKFQIKHFIRKRLGLKSSKSHPQALLKIGLQMLLKIEPQTLL